MICLAIVCVLIALSLYNQYNRYKRLQWASYTDNFYKGFWLLLLYVLLMGIAIGWGISK
jgi:TRAP-type C4-dicarboxylate transport system permease large subunit